MVRRGFSVILAKIATLIATGCGGTEDKGGAPGGRENTESGSGAASETKGGETTGGAEGGQLTAVMAGQIIVGTSYVSPLVEVFGDVYIGKQSFVASNTVLRAAPDQRLDIGNETNAQDNVIVRSLVGLSRIGDETSLAHHAVVRDSTIGNFAFVGFDAEIIDSTVEDGALISAGAVIEAFPRSTCPSTLERA
jgi:NDP-sugar pyrophosphorylase family protein